MRPLNLTAGGTFIQSLNILQGLASHLTMALFHMRGLILGDSAEDGFPEIGEQRRDGDGDGESEGGRDAGTGSEEPRERRQHSQGHGGGMIPR